ncbi:MAG: CaiB/BaiF CoA-transferase family protein [Steroidobacteraceae bacterium]
MPGPLHGIKVIEIEGLGPAPFCGMMLADAGADVITITRPRGKELSSLRAGAEDAIGRGRRQIALDLKKPEAIEAVLRMIERADVLIEGFRPGTMEKLGLGPDVCLQRNAKLVYGRMTGWGQTGPLALAAGHDINYIALTGALHAIGPKSEPVPPLNLVGDYGGGGMLLAFGVCAALVESIRTGKGQVIDAAMCDGAALLMAPFYTMLASGQWRDERQSNAVDGGAPYYGPYRCKDGKFISIASLEPQFYALLVKLLDLKDEVFQHREDRANWPKMRELLAARFAERTRDEWCAVLEGTDICFAPVLTLGEASSHRHISARNTLVKVGSGVQPAPAPRFSRTVSEMRRAASANIDTSRQVLKDSGFSEAEIAALIDSRAVSQ